MIQNIEPVSSLINSDAYVKLFRINYNGQRIYIRNVPFSYYSGLTSALDGSRPSNDPNRKFLEGWRNKMIDQYGQKRTEDYVSQTADFGTMVHEALVRIKEKREIDWVEERERSVHTFRQQLLERQIDNMSLAYDMSFEYCKHIGSIQQFIYDRVEEIYAIEVPAIWEVCKIATPIDLVCKCSQTPKGEKATTVINIKTSGQISEHHLQQVACELVMWNGTYEDQAEYSAILRTKDWTDGKTPTYEYKYQDIDQSVEIAGNAMDYLLLNLKQKRSYYPEPRFRAFKGTSKLGEIPQIEEITLDQEWAEYWNKQKEQ